MNPDLSTNTSVNPINSNKQRILLGILTLLLMVVSITGAVLYNNLHNAREDLYSAQAQLNEKTEQLKQANEDLAQSQKSPEVVAKEEVANIKTKVGKLTTLPAGEPTVATVVDASKLKGQSFFAEAQNDDKVLIFTEANKSILYRPAEDRIINMADVTP